MPAGFTLNTLPQPVDTLITIRQVRSKKVAVIRFSGFLAQENIEENAKNLPTWIDTKGYLALSSPRSAGYDPPWTIPFLRRNEVQIDIE
jgi:DNA gyrase inhibitor GyrI